MGAVASFEPFPKGGIARPSRQSTVQARTGLCPHSNQSLRAAQNSAGKTFGEARDRDGIFGDAS
jgi:hypothetical protein